MEKGTVPGSERPRVPGYQDSRVQDIKVTFKYELDSKEGPSCFTTYINLKDALLFEVQSLVDQKCGNQ